MKITIRQKPLKYLKQISAKSALNENEEVERAEVSVDVFEARGNPENAKKFLDELVADWKGQPVAVSGLYLRLAKIDNQLKNRNAAEVAISKILNLQTDSGLVPDEIVAGALGNEG